ncbi:MAG TPA: two-component system response regulator, partial [Syntrophobacteraceae bacterium]|nr:two-component system response regulator [Syntrophobacteraceae bacterium]
MRRILFVDDEPKVLEGLKRMLHGMRREWEMAFANGGMEALEILNTKSFDVVISDMRMPGMDGYQLLEKVRQLHPEAVRIILSGYSDRELILRSVRSAHQYLAKPCEAEMVKSTVARACALRDLLKDDSLAKLISQIDSLPSLPTLYTKVIDELNSPSSSIQKIAEIIASDVGMTAKILQLANSAFFGLSQHVNSPLRAVTILGLDTIKALIMTVQIFSQFDRSTPSGFSIADLWEHSMRCGVFAKTIAKAEAQERIAVEDGFMGGLLHDVGKLVLVANLPERYHEALTLAADPSRTLWEAEQEVFGTTHAQVGAYLMGLWGLPDRIVEAIAFHHSPSECLDLSFSTLTAVHVADALEHDLTSGGDPRTDTRLNREYLGALKVADRVPVWTAACEPL